MITKSNMPIYLSNNSTLSNRPAEMKQILGEGVPIMKYCRPPWLADEEDFSFQIV